jgi:hypothetical protein
LIMASLSVSHLKRVCRLVWMARPMPSITCSRKQQQQQQQPGQQGAGAAAVSSRAGK